MGRSAESRWPRISPNVHVARLRRRSGAAMLTRRQPKLTTGQLTLLTELLTAAPSGIAVELLRNARKGRLTLDDHSALGPIVQAAYFAGAQLSPRGKQVDKLRSRLDNILHAQAADRMADYQFYYGGTA